MPKYINKTEMFLGHRLVQDPASDKSHCSYCGKKFDGIDLSQIRYSIAHGGGNAKDFSCKLK